MEGMLGKGTRGLREEAKMGGKLEQRRETREERMGGGYARGIHSDSLHWKIPLSLGVDFQGLEGLQVEGKLLKIVLPPLRALSQPI